MLYSFYFSPPFLQGNRCLYIGRYPDRNCHLCIPDFDIVLGYGCRVWRKSEQSGITRCQRKLPSRATKTTDFLMSDTRQPTYILRFHAKSLDILTIQITYVLINWSVSGSQYHLARRPYHLIIISWDTLNSRSQCIFFSISNNSV